MWSRLRKAAVVCAGVLVIFAAAQLVRPERTNPPTIYSETLQAQAGPANEWVDVLDRSCADCHSNETMWARYPQIAPLSWLVVGGVMEGRKVLNFSEWGAYSTEQRRALLVASCRDAQTGTMPGRAFTLLRPEARLSARDVELICAASRSPEATRATSSESQTRSAR